MTLADAVDLWLGEVARRLAARTHLKYGQLSEKFVEHLGEKYPINEIRPEHCMSWLSNWNNAKPKTKALHHTVLNMFFQFLVDMDYLEPNENPMLKVKPPKVPRAEDREVKTISSDEVKHVIAACHTWSEMITIAILACMGVRRQAANDLKWKDVRFHTGHIRFKEKGGKIIWKPMPSLLENLLVRAKESGELPTTSTDYVIPSEGKLRNDVRDADYIYRVVKRVSKRAGVDAHCHAFRAAFAVHYLQTHAGDLEALQPLMGHTNLATTQVYLRRLNKEAAMERVRDLDWGVGFGALNAGRAGEPSKPPEARPALSALTEGAIGDTVTAGSPPPSVSALNGEGA